MAISKRLWSHYSKPSDGLGLAQEQFGAASVAPPTIGSASVPCAIFVGVGTLLGGGTSGDAGTVRSGLVSWNQKHACVPTAY